MYRTIFAQSGGPCVCLVPELGGHWGVFSSCSRAGLHPTRLSSPCDCEPACQSAPSACLSALCSAGGFLRLPWPIRGSSKVSVPDKVNIVIRADPLAWRPTLTDWRLPQLIIALLFNTTQGYLPARQPANQPTTEE